MRAGIKQPNPKWYKSLDDHSEKKNNNDDGTENRRTGRRGACLFGQPFFALLGILVQELRQIADDERQHNRGEELGTPLQLEVG